MYFFFMLFNFLVILFFFSFIYVVYGINDLLIRKYLNVYYFRVLNFSYFCIVIQVLLGYIYVFNLYFYLFYSRNSSFLNIKEIQLVFYKENFIFISSYR